MVWYSHLFQNFPQFILIHTVKGFGVVNKADVLLELSCFFYDLMDAGNVISGSSAFSKSGLNIWRFSVYILLNDKCTYICINSQASSDMIFLRLEIRAFTLDVSNQENSYKWCLQLVSS